MQDDNYPEILQDLKNSVTASLIDSGIDAETARQSAHLAAETIRKNWGGAPVYICKGQEYELSRRDQKIWDEFSGNNHRELCRKYDITLQWLYKIIKHQRQQDLKKRQGDLFE